MDLITIIFLALTCLAIIGGLVLGLIRGFKRSILKTVLTLLCVVGAFFLRTVIAEIIYNIKISGKTIWQTVIDLIPSELYNASSDLIDSILHIVFELATFVVVFILLEIIVSALFYPLLKLLFFSKERKAKKHGFRVKKRKLLGAILGLVEGAIIAFTLCVPLTGVSYQVDKVLGIEFEGKKIEVDINLKDYNESFLGKTYMDIGGWAFDLLAQTQNSKGETIKLDATVDAVVGVSKMTKQFETISKLDLSSGLTENNVNDLCAALKDLDAIKGDLNEDSKKIINDVITDFSEASGEDISKWIPEDFDINDLDFTAASDAISSMYDYSNSKTITQEGANDIIKGLEKNEVILNALSEGAGSSTSLVSVQPEDKAKFNTALENSTLSSELQDKVRNILGIAD